jgi:hypothetical protein
MPITVDLCCGSGGGELRLILVERGWDSIKNMKNDYTRAAWLFRGEAVSQAVKKRSLNIPENKEVLKS